jgi:cyanosortase A-associated protein
MPLFTILEKFTQHKRSQDSIPKWQQQRQILLAIAFASIVLALGRISFGSPPGQRSLSAFTFPSIVPLPEWQLIDSSALEQATTQPANSYDAVIASRKYLYKQKGQLLTIEMRYMASNLGNLEEYLNRHAAMKISESQLLQNLRDRQDIGFYSLFTYQGRSHLATCINPRGGSTITNAQFLANRYKYDLQWQHWLPWLLGKAGLPDKRCLWVNLSMPQNRESTKATYPILEQTWRSWYQWWSSRYPQI